MLCTPLWVHGNRTFLHLVHVINSCTELSTILPGNEVYFAVAGEMDNSLFSCRSFSYDWLLFPSFSLFHISDFTSHIIGNSFVLPTGENEIGKSKRYRQTEVG